MVVVVCCWLLLVVVMLVARLIVYRLILRLYLGTIVYTGYRIINS